MKKIFAAISVLLLFLFVGGYVYGRNTPRISQQEVPRQAVSPSAMPTGEIASVSQIALPSVLSIPKLGIEATVESVGLDAKKNMDVPKLAQNVGWYNLGVKPGEKGNAVMAGHLDTATGAPAVFYKLDELQIGDEVSVKDEVGNEYTYMVTGKRTYVADTFPLQEVFGATEKYRLNLITCSGQFNNAANNYSHRTVIYSELSEPTL